jgi:diguanylate cyclase (GGDEF)-like protein
MEVYGGLGEPACFAPDVSRPHSSPTSADPAHGRIRWTWRLFAGSFFLLGLFLVLRMVVDGGRPLDYVLVGLLGIVGFAAVRHHQAANGLEVARRSEAESFARILQGLSRSVSPEAIVEAIVGDLGAGTGADHIVVVSRQPEENRLEATLVSTRPGVPSSRTTFPLADLEAPAPAVHDRRGSVALRLVPISVGAGPPAGASMVATLPRLAAPRHSPAHRPDRTRTAARMDDELATRVAERIAARARDAYGLRHTLSAPLRDGNSVVGAIVLSRRTPDGWSPAAQRILAGAAVEASAALTRAYSHRQAEEAASTDALTGLPNRRYFDEFCGLVARRRRANDALGVLMIDVDRFKALNDRHGHAAGDEVLRAVGMTIADAVREDDVPARFGGEEFAVLLRNPSPTVAIEIAERVRHAVAVLDLRSIGIPGVTVSVGVAVASRPDQPIRELLDAADQALYRAKRAGRDRVIAA